MEAGGKALETSTVPIIGNFNLTSQMPNGRTMQIAGYLYEGEDGESINNRIDMCQEVMERQRKRLEVPELEAKLDQLQTGLTQQMEAYNALMEREGGKGPKLGTAEKSAMKSYPINIKRLKEEIEKGQRAIDEAKASGGLA